MTATSLAGRFDPAALPELEASRRGQRIATLLARGDFAPVAALTRATGSMADTNAVAALRTAISDHAERHRAEGETAEWLRLAEMLVALTPDRPEPLINLCAAARRAGNWDKLEAGLATLVARFPEAPGFRRLAERLAGDLAKEVSGSSTRAARLACAAAAAGVLAPSLFGALAELFRSQRVPAARLARLCDLCPAFVEHQAVREVATRWHDAAMALPPADALLELARLVPLLPVDRVALDMLRLTVELGRPPQPPLLALLPRAAGRLPAGAVREAERLWRHQLRAKWDAGDSQLAYACFHGLEALGVLRPSDLALAVAAIDEVGDPDGRLPELLERCRKAGIETLPQISDWRNAFRDAKRQGSATEIWLYGRRLLALDRAPPETPESLLDAAGRFKAPPQALFDLAEQMARAGVAPSRPIHPNAARAIATAALAQLQAGMVRGGLRVLGWAMEHARLRAATLLPAGRLLADHAGTELHDALAELREHHPTAAHLLGALAAQHAGEQAEAVRGFEAALAAGLPEDLDQLAEREVLAGSFTLVSSNLHEGEGAIVLIEPRANQGLLERALPLASNVQVCSPEYVGAEVEDGQVSGEIEFRFVDLPEVSEACEAFSAWALRAMERQAKRLGLGTLIPARHREHVRRHLSHRLFAHLRVAYNFQQAILKSGLRRVFFIVNARQPARVVAHGLREEGGHELRVACGAASAGARRDFVPRSITDPIVRPEPEQPKPPREAKFVPECLPRFAHLPTRGAARPTLLLVITSSRPDVIAPLPDLVAAVLDRWNPAVVFLDSNGGSEQMRAALSRDTRPGVADVAFHIVRTPSLWAEALTEYDAAPIQRSIAAIDPASSRMRRAGLLLGTDIIDVFQGVEGAAAVAMAMDGWARRVTRTLSPVGALFTHSSILEPNVLCAALSGAGVPTFWLQLLQHPRDKRFMRPPADHHLLLDRYSAELWQDFLGVPAKDCTVVGSLRISQVLNRVRGLSREETRAELGLQDSERLVLIATQPVAVQDNLVLIENVVAALGELPGIRVLVKLHPAENEDRILAYARAFDGSPLAGAAEVTNQRDIYRSIIASDLVVVQHSNVGIEALMMDRAAIALVVEKRIATFSIAEHGVEEVQAGPEAVARIRALMTDSVARAEADGRRRALLDANPEMHDGRAAERIVGRMAERIEAMRNTP